MPALDLISNKYQILKKDIINELNKIIKKHCEKKFNQELDDNYTLMLVNANGHVAMSDVGIGLNLTDLSIAEAFSYYDPTIIQSILDGDIDTFGIIAKIENFLAAYLKYCKNIYNCSLVWTTMYVTDNTSYPSSINALKTLSKAKKKTKSSK